MDNQTLQLDNEKLENLVNTIKTLEVEIQHRLDNEKDDENNEYEKMRSHQTHFYDFHVECIKSCIKTSMDKFAADSIEGVNCRKLLDKFQCMRELYNQDIFADCLISDLKSRELTILLAIADLQKYRC